MKTFRNSNRNLIQTFSVASFRFGSTVEGKILFAEKSAGERTMLVVQWNLDLCICVFLFFVLVYLRICVFVYLWICVLVYLHICIFVYLQKAAGGEKDACVQWNLDTFNPTWEKEQFAESLYSQILPNTFSPGYKLCPGYGKCTNEGNAKVVFFKNILYTKYKMLQIE